MSWDRSAVHTTIVCADPNLSLSFQNSSWPVKEANDRVIHKGAIFSSVLPPTTFLSDHCDIVNDTRDTEVSPKPQTS